VQVINDFRITLIAMNNSMHGDVRVHAVSVVVPVYGGKQSLEALVEELRQYIEPVHKSDGAAFVIAEVVLVDDCGSDGSDQIIRYLASVYPWVRPVWLSRNFGQHAATIAGMAATSSEWIVTLDEDGQHDPLDIGAMIAVATSTKSPLVYAKAINKEPHGFVRNLASRLLKRALLPLLLDRSHLGYFSSFRLVTGEAGRTVAAYASSGVYLDVALSWVARTSTTCDVLFRKELRPNSGYSSRKLMSHFLRLVVSSGTRPLRIISVGGVASFLTGSVFATTILVQKYTNGYPVVGWASLFALVLLIGGLILLTLGIIAEYVGALVRKSIGLPLYVVVNDPFVGPLNN